MHPISQQSPTGDDGVADGGGTSGKRAKKKAVRKKPAAAQTEPAVVDEAALKVSM